MSEDKLKPESKGFKEFALSSFSVDNRTTIYVLTAIIFIAGLFSYNSMPKESFPEIIVPEIYIGTAYPGNSPLDIEKLITRPFEKEINGITGIDEITSTSTQGYSSISVKFDFSVSPTEALRKVKDKIDIAMSDSDFPTDLPADPNVFEMNFSELIPVMNINLSGNYSLNQLKDYAEYLEDEIEDLPEITNVDIRGVMDEEVKVNIDLLAIEAREINFDDIANAISAENTTISGGNLLVDDFRRNVRVIGEFKNIQEIENIVVKREKQEVVYLKDIAEVEFGEKEKTSYARELLQPVVMVDVIKRAGENLLDASDKIRVIVDGAKDDIFPEDLKVTITNDQSDQTRTQLEELENSIIFGIILVVGVLLFFLGLRNALFVGIAIPLSMLMSFAILSAFGVTLNMMVLFALVLALGMLVDNGIVVVENIYRLMDEGYSPIQAAKLGVGEVAIPIIASTATTLAAFLPLAFWPGMMGEFMFYLPTTLIIVLSSSLFVALVVNPVLTSAFMKVEEAPANKRKIFRIYIILIGLGIIFDFLGYFTFGNLMIIAGLLGFINYYFLTPGTHYFQKRILPSFENRYQNFLSRTLKGKRPYAFVGGTFLLLILSVMLVGVFPPKVEFFPVNEPLYLNIFIENPIGTDIEETNRIAKEIEETTMDILDKYYSTDENGKKSSFLVESIIGQVGDGTSDPNQGPSNANTPHKARITVQFVKFQERQGVETTKVLAEIRNGLKNYPGTQVTVNKNEDGPPQGAPINIELKGEDYDILMADAVNLKNFIEAGNIAGIEGLKLDIETGKPEMPIIIDREKARRLDLSTAEIGNAMRTALFGREVSTYKEGEDDYPINIRLMKKYRDNEDALMDQRITFRDQTSGDIRQIPISAVARAEKSSTFSAVKRLDLDRVITISSNVLTNYNPTEVVENIAKHIENFDANKDTTISFTGQQEEMAEQMDFLSKALAIALFIIILIIVAQFNAVSTPFIIAFSVLFSLIGVFLGLLIFRMDFIIIMTMIGIISLAGIVVNNAIVLIDYTNLIRLRKREEMNIPEGEVLPFNETVKAIIEGGKTRLRPVLLTAITTVLGLLPLAVGMNINFFTLLSDFDPQIYVGGDNAIFWGPMAWTIIYGLIFATFLTLVIVPLMYMILAKTKYKVIHKKDTTYSIR